MTLRQLVCRRGIIGVVWQEREKSGLLIVVSGLMTLVVLVAAVLLYRWINRVGGADRVRQKELLEVAFRGFQSEFVSAVQEIHSTFRPLAGFQGETQIEAHLSEMFDQWQNNARQPQLIGGLTIGTIDSKGSLAFHRFLQHEKKFEKQEWPPELQSYRDLLMQRWSQRALPTALPGGFPLAISADRPIMAIPATFFRSMVPNRRPDRDRIPLASRDGPLAPPDRSQFMDRRAFTPSPPTPPLQRVSNDTSPGVAGWYFVELDAQFLKQQFLPNLAERHFGGASLSRYRLAVVAGSPRQAIYLSDPGLTLESFDAVDMAAPLLRFQGRFGFGFRPRSRLIPPADLMPGELQPEPRPPLNRASHEAGANPSGASWQLLARHQLIHRCRGQ